MMQYGSIESFETLLASQTGVADGVYTTQDSDDVVIFSKNIEKAIISAPSAALKLKINGGNAIINVATTENLVIDNFFIQNITIVGDAGQTIGLIGFTNGIER